MALSTFRANTFRADTFKTAFHNNVVALIKRGGRSGEVIPDVRIITVDMVLNEINFSQLISMVIPVIARVMDE